MSTTSGGRVGLARPPRLDFQGRLLDEEDGLVLGFTSVFGTGAAVLMIAAKLLLPVEVEEGPMRPEVYTRLDLNRLMPPRPAAARPVAPPAPSAAPGPVARRDPPRSSASPVPEQRDAAAPRFDPAHPVSPEILAIGTRGPSIQRTDVRTMSELLPGDSRAAPHVETRMRGPSGTGNADIGALDTIGVPDGNDFTCFFDPPVVHRPPPIGTPDDPRPEPHPPIKPREHDIRYCYDQRLKVDPRIAGRVELTVDIVDGHVRAAMIELDTTGDAALGECIVAKAKRWSFPAGTGDAEATFPFVFKTGK